MINGNESDCYLGDSVVIEGGTERVLEMFVCVCMYVCVCVFTHQWLPVLAC